MDTFDLRWPKTDAIFYTDGNRCRIVWRQKGGPGGSIENIELCKRRVADSLTCAPELLEALQGKGYTGLATEIASLVGTPRNPVSVTRLQKNVRANKATRPPKSGPKITRKIAQERVVKLEPEQVWLNGLEGRAEWQECGTRRGKTWQLLDTLEMDGCAREIWLKAPSRRGARDWVVKLKPATARGKATYVCADSLKGLFSYLLRARSGTSSQPGAVSAKADLQRWLEASQALEHEALSAALSAWEKVIARS